LNRSVKIFPSSHKLAEVLASDLIRQINKARQIATPLTIVLSGGTTPKLLFRILAEKYAESVDWSYVHLFWGDERCVPPDDPESNFGMTREILLSKIEIPENNIHRIRGEENPEMEALRYSDDIVVFTPLRNRIPHFDIIILGMGNDGHTASIFPGSLNLMKSDKVCEVSVHPVTRQKRVTLTGKVINNAGRIVFMVTGTEKAHIIRDIFNKEAVSTNYPATYIVPTHGKVEWLLDEKAGEFIS
jgi:6-phosphogluconolactonase